jgi:hypothetical protein
MLVPKRQAINTSLFYKTGCIIVWQVKTKITISNIATLLFRRKQQGNFFLRLSHTTTRRYLWSGGISPTILSFGPRCRYAFVFMTKSQHVFRVRQEFNCSLQQGCTNPGRQVAVANNCYMVARNICASSAWDLIPFTLLSLTI